MAELCQSSLPVNDLLLVFIVNRLEDDRNTLFDRYIDLKPRPTKFFSPIPIFVIRSVCAENTEFLEFLNFKNVLYCLGKMYYSVHSYRRSFYTDLSTLIIK